jgi:thiamine pyrophosphokinase
MFRNTPGFCNMTLSIFIAFQRDLDVIIGDLDSVESSARNYYENQGTEIIQDGDQYSTDFGKAIVYLRKKYGQQTIVTYGGLGGRVDQGLSQLHHLYLFQQEPGYSQGQLYLVSEESITFLLKAGSHRIRVRGYGKGDRDCDVFGKHVGIIPIREPSQISTKGLEWDVTEWHTEIGGLVSTSNHVLPETEVVEVQTTKDVIFTIALRLPREN